MEIRCIQEVSVEGCRLNQINPNGIASVKVATVVLILKSKTGTQSR